MARYQTIDLSRVVARIKSCEAIEDLELGELKIVGSIQFFDRWKKLLPILHTQPLDTLAIRFGIRGLCNIQGVGTRTFRVWEHIVAIDVLEVQPIGIVEELEGQNWVKLINR
jgi:hypothetical protein